jgi:DDE superfamily endonuclease
MPLIQSKLGNFPKNRALSASTGCNFKKWAIILPVFTLFLAQHKAKIHKSADKRTRKVGGGRKNSLPTATDALVFILYYYKTYPTFSALGTRIGTTHTTAHQQVHFLSQVLLDTLTELKFVPPREFKTEQELHDYLKSLGDVKDILIDATERRTQRPKKKEARDPLYSGKKKTFTIKNTVITLLNGFIVFLGLTTQGTVHDYELFKIEFSWYQGLKDWFKDLNVWIDLGYIGIKDDFNIGKLNIPVKKPKKSKENPKPTLSDEEKAHNKAVAQTRVLVEHTIGSMKYFNILNHPYRNKKHFFEDKIIAICAAMHNASY